MTFIIKNKNIILDAIQLLLFFLLGFRFLNIEFALSIVLFTFVAARYIWQERISGFKNNILSKKLDYIVLIILVLSLFLFKSVFDGKQSIFQNAFHFIVLPLTFWISTKTTNSFLSYNGMTSLLSYFVGSFLFIMLCGGITFAEYGLKSNVRLIINVWNKEYITSTLASIYLLPTSVLSIVLLAYFLFKKKVLIALLLIPPFILSFYFSIQLSNRGFFAAFAIAALLFCFFIYTKVKNPPKYFDLVVFIPLVLTVLFLTLTLMIKFNAFGISDYLSKIPIFERFINGGSDPWRKEIYREFFANAWRYPFGGLIQSGVLQAGSYVHNVLFDLYGSAGIISFVCFVYFIVRVAYCSLRSKKYNSSILFCSILIILFLSVFSISMFEPTFNANSYYFASFFGFFSIVSRDSKWKEKAKNGNEVLINEESASN